MCLSVPSQIKEGSIELFCVPGPTTIKSDCLIASMTFLLVSGRTASSFRNVSLYSIFLFSRLFFKSAKDFGFIRNRSVIGALD